MAATLLQQPDLFSQYGLLPPERLFQGVLMISGVLAVRPQKVTFSEKVTAKKQCTVATPPGPQWLTDFVLTTVWGPNADKIPSPLVMQNDPKLPHLLVGCRNECFGLSWLDVFFCSRQYSQKVQHVTGKYANYVQVESDHWNILKSAALRDALQEELPKLVVAN